MKNTIGVTLTTLQPSSNLKRARFLAMFSGFDLCYITDQHAYYPKPLLTRLLEAARVGVDVVQIREKDLGTRELLQLVEQTLEGVRRLEGARTRVVVNDRLDVALAAEADGVHLGAASLPAESVRATVSSRFLVGVSCHSLAEAVAAEASGADYILLGPIFATPSKLGYGQPLGLSILEEVTRRVRIPVLALGGITVERVKPCLERGAAGIAAIRLFQNCDSLDVRVRELRAQFTLKMG